MAFNPVSELVVTQGQKVLVCSVRSEFTWKFRSCVSLAYITGPNMMLPYLVCWFMLYHFVTIWSVRFSRRQGHPCVGSCFISAVNNGHFIICCNIDTELRWTFDHICTYFSWWCRLCTYVSRLDFLCSETVALGLLYTYLFYLPVTGI